MSEPETTQEPVTTPEPAERIYFPELDGLRFVAFLMVYFFHGGAPGSAQAGHRQGGHGSLPG